MRVKVLNGKNELYIEAEPKQNLLTVLLENNVFVPNICRGNGTCGKCKVRVVEGYLPITEADKRLLSEPELKQGIRLACKAKIGINLEEKDVHEIKKKIGSKEEDRLKQDELWIEIIGQSEEDIVAEKIREEKTSENYKKENIQNLSKSERERQFDENKKADNYFIAIDIGTTTIAMALIKEETGEVLDTYTSLNHQRKYGADVISRITAANAGKTEELKYLIEEDLWKGIETLIGTKDNIKTESNSSENGIHELERRIKLSRIMIAGNTTMIHLLMGYSCESLGKHPFVSEHLEKIECRMKGIPVTILPGISAFVGGDVVADILACDDFETKEICLLLDLGTNGEMVLGNKNKLLTTSTAAGPALEGGNITCGVASIPGSICQVKIERQRAVVRTIKNKMPPNGICGTGLISTVAQLKRNKMIGKTGELKQPFDKKGFPLWTFENGENIALYQKDVHEFQMAKAALRAGIEILMEEYGCEYDDVKKVMVAGGFGKAFNIEDMMITGILPKEFENKVTVIGNGVLQGISKLALCETYEERMKAVCQRAENISLSQKESFQRKYLECMNL